MHLLRELTQALGRLLTVAGSFAQNILALVALAVVVLGVLQTSVPAASHVFQWLVAIFQRLV